MTVSAKSVNRGWRLLLCAAVPACAIAPARAQVGESLLLPPVIPPGFNRGRNQSVTELPRHAFDPVGIRVGSFNLLPSIQSGGGATSNTYYTAEPTASAFISTTPSATLISRWSRHELAVSGTATFREYIGESRRNESTWQSDVRGRVDLGRFSSVTIEEISSQANESQFTGEVTPIVAALSRYRRDFLSVRGVNQVGRTRTTISADYALFRYQPIPLLTGETRDQSYRDRNIARVTGQFEYALSPSLAVFVQGSFANQAFRTELSPGVPNLDSNGYRALSGINFDLPGKVRGSLGIGYTHQSFLATLYKAVSGVSFEGQLEIFPTRLTTVTLGARRSIEITNLGVSGAYWNNRVNARVDREIWRGILINATGEYTRQSYVRTTQTGSGYRFGTGARYLSSRKVVVDGSVSYSKRATSAGSVVTLGNEYDEVRGEVGLTFRI
ncbi:outer membrane beta-barrel protein [Sphingomonas sp. H39-1-10]|uniref:outer membrane beta-barrel protein n=1 Tax=Sphingomonas pollutisoli TaxID=3030829 RepID=UPI0023B9CDB7|nr:outer membrane beta-barrel protein [Sphingomonas pollutisoli]MDF0490649.1 outer membrane beta-barrel protein [Sphingomonas pollutisoli]